MVPSCEPPLMMSEVLFVLAETKNRSEEPYTSRKIRTQRGCLKGLALHQSPGKVFEM